MSVRSNKDRLRTEVDELLRHRPGWRLQAMSTPGLPPQWCFGSGGQADLSIAIDGDSISVYVVEQDRDVALGGPEGLVAWLKANKPEAFKDPKESAGGKLKRGRLFDWE